MISEVFTVKVLKKIGPLLLILILALFLRLYKINDTFPFDFDQETAANAAYDFFTYHKITLIGQELSFEGFFLGPLHNWIQFIPYGLCNLRPDCVPYFYTLISLITIGMLFIVVRKTIGKKAALISCTIFGLSFAQISYEIGVNSNYFLFLSSVGLFFAVYKYFQGSNLFLIIGAFLAGVATVNFNPVFIFSTLAFYLTALLRKDRSVLFFSGAILAFLINYIPLIIFNFRHDNILWHNFQKFSAYSTSSQDYLERSQFIVKNVLIPFNSNFLFQSASIFWEAITLFLIALGLTKAAKSGDRFWLFFPIWIIIPIIGFTVYRGHVPDYYFQQTLLPFIILIAFAARRNLLIFMVFMLFFFFTNISRAINYQTIINYQFKKDAVNFIVNDSKKETFNVYYEIPVGFNTGYRYLFKVSGREPHDGSQNLYIIEFTDDFALDKYRETFKDRNINLKVIGSLNIISVK